MKRRSAAPTTPNHRSVKGRSGLGPPRRMGRGKSRRGPGGVKALPPWPGMVAIAWGLLAAAVPMALASVPLYFNPRTERVFEPDKLAWLVWLALLAAWALTVLALGTPVSVSRAARAVRGVPALTWLVALTVGLLVLATVASPVPVVSLWGAYRRGHGLIVQVSYIVLALGLAMSLRLPGAVARLRYALLLPALPVSLYALLQRLGIDSIPWRIYGTSTLERPFGPMGNPIFLGAYLAMIVPLAMADLLEDQSAARPGPRRRQLFDLAVVGLATLALLASASRGPLLGLGIGVVLLALLWSAVTARRRLALAIVLLAASAAAALALVGQARPEGHRFLAALSPTSRTAQERILVWQALADLAVAEPERAWLGYGLQNMAYVVGPHVPDELVRLAPRQTFDSAHNLIWEWWLAAGILGVVAILLLYGGAFWMGMRCLGLAATTRQRRWLAVLLLGGTTLGGLAVLLLRRPAYLGLGLPMGLLAGLFAYVLIRVFSSRARTSLDRSWLLAGAVAALAAHLTEQMLGLPTAAAELLFWTILGWLMVAQNLPEAKPEHTLTAEEAGLVGGMSVAAVAHAPLLLPSLGSSLRLPALWLLLPTAWLAGDAVPQAAPLASARRALPRLFLLLALVLCVTASRSVPGGPALAFGAVLTTATLLLALFIARRAPGTGPARADHPVPASIPLTTARATLASLLSLLMLAAGWYFVAAPVLADSQIRAGLEAAARGDRPSARRHFTGATRLWPQQPAYAEYVAAVDRDVMVAPETPADIRGEAFRVADSTLAGAVSELPDPVLVMRRAILWRDWGDLAAVASERQAAWAQSERLFAAALERMPHSPRLLCEHAKLLERTGDAAGASAAYSLAAWLDPGLAEAWAGTLRLTLVQSGLAEARVRLDEALTPGGVAPDQLAEALDAAREWPIDQRAALGAQVLYYGRVRRLTDATAAWRALRELEPTNPWLSELERWLAKP